MPINEIGLTTQGVSQSDVDSIATKLGGFGNVIERFPLKASAEQQIVHSVAIAFATISKEFYTEAGRMVLRELASLLHSALSKSDGPYSCSQEFKADGMECKVSVRVPTKAAYDQAMDTFNNEFEKLLDLVAKKRLPPDTWIAAAEYDEEGRRYRLKVVTQGIKHIEYDEESGTWK